MPLFPDSARSYHLNLRRFWQPRQPREQAGIAVIAALLMIVFFWKCLLEPSVLYREKAKSNYHTLLQQRSWLQSHPPAHPAQPITGTPTVSAIVSQSAAYYHITLGSLSQQGDNQFAITLSGAVFADAVHWLDALENQYHLTIYALEVNKTGEGLADITLTVGQ